MNDFWDWAPNAPKKIDCEDVDQLGKLPYRPYGCMGCGRMKATRFEDGRALEFYCELGLSTVQFTVKRSKPSIEGGRNIFFVMYRTHEPRE